MVENKEEQFGDNVIIVKSKENIYTFEKDTYKEDLLSDCIPKQKYNEIIEAAGKTMGQSWAKKRANDMITIPKVVIILSTLAFFLTIAYMVTLYTSTTAKEEKDKTALFVISIICISSASIIVFGLSIYNFCRKIGKFKSLDMIIKEDLMNDFKVINSQYTGLLNFTYDENGKRIIVTALNKGKKKINSNYRGNDIEMKNLE